MRHVVDDELPESIRDLKLSLARIINARYKSLRKLATAAKLSPDTVSKAVNLRSSAPSPRTVHMILEACGQPDLNDGRYDGWKDLCNRAWHAQETLVDHRNDLGSSSRNSIPRPRRDFKSSASSSDKGYQRATDRASTKSGYIARSIATYPLHDRAAELSKLISFARSHSADSYLWWQARPWAGKSALTARLVLEAPGDLQVVSFFIASQFQGQADSFSFMRSMVEQLSSLLNRPVDLPDSPLGWKPAFEDLLDDFAAQLRPQDKSLLLVVDGLDEDLGAHALSGMPSIASLLPHRVDGSYKVFITSRLHPGLPGDVPASHPVRHCNRLDFAPSEYAQDIKRLAERELVWKDLLTFTLRGGLHHRSRWRAGGPPCGT